MRAKLGDGVMACGNATKDAEFKRLGEKNTPNCKWGMAVGKDKDENTVFVNCEAWSKLACLAASIQKGDPVLVFGKMRSYEYNDKTYYTLVAEFVQFVGGEQKILQQGEPQRQGEILPLADDGDLPF